MGMAPSLCVTTGVLYVLGYQHYVYSNVVPWGLVFGLVYVKKKNEMD